MILAATLAVLAAAVWIVARRRRSRRGAYRLIVSLRPLAPLD